MTDAPPPDPLAELFEDDRVERYSKGQIDAVDLWRDRRNNDEWRWPVGVLVNLIDDLADEVYATRSREASAELLGKEPSSGELLADALELVRNVVSTLTAIADRESDDVVESAMVDLAAARLALDAVGTPGPPKGRKVPPASPPP